MSARRVKRANPLAGSSGKILSPRSSVWRFFKLNRETRRAQCNFCQRILAYTGGTTNLRYHLTASHEMEEFEVIGPSAKVFKPNKKTVRPRGRPRKYQPISAKVKSEGLANDGFLENTPQIAGTEFSAIRSPSLSTEVPQSPPSASHVQLPCSPQQSSLEILKKRRTHKDENREGAVTDNLLLLIIRGLHPVEFAASGGFKEYMKFLEPSYKLPEKCWLQSRILTMFERGKVKLRSVLVEDAIKYSVVYDVWKGSDQEAYTTVIIHYLTSTWENRSYVLGTEQLSQYKVSGEELGSCIRKLLFQYDLAPEALIAALYCGGTVKSPVERVGSSLQCESSSCAAEKLALCVQTAFAVPEVKAVITQVGKITSYLIHDEEASSLMKELKESDDHVPTVELVEDRKGSWIATSDMLMAFVSLRDLVDQVLEMDTCTDNEDLYLGAEKWELLEKLVNTLQILRAALTVMSNERTGSVSCLLPVVHSILQHCEDANHTPNSAMEKFVKTVGKEVRVRWDLTAILPSSVPMLSALLDPRFKKLKFIAEEDKDDVLEALKGVIELNLNVENGDDCDVKPRSNDVTPFLCLFGGEEEYADEKHDLDTEIKNYVDFPPLRHDSCPLDWWRVNKGRFPQLAKLARQFLSLPAVAQPTEDIMAGSSRTNGKRALLEVEVAAALIFLNRNLSLIHS